MVLLNSHGLCTITDSFSWPISTVCDEQRSYFYCYSLSTTLWSVYMLLEDHQQSPSNLRQFSSFWLFVKTMKTVAKPLGGSWAPRDRVARDAHLWSAVKSIRHQWPWVKQRENEGQCKRVNGQANSGWERWVKTWFMSLQHRWGSECRLHRRHLKVRSSVQRTLTDDEAGQHSF